MYIDEINTADIISTHTLTWSVTNVVNLLEMYNTISTHTLTWSVTGAKEHTLFEKSHFNSHAHVERDTIGSACVAEFFNFNSHAHVERDAHTFPIQCYH